MLRHVAEIPTWDPDAGGPAYVYVRMADHLAARIAAGELPPDARLPAERDLAAEYGVAIGTARRATEELRDRGLVVTLPGKGTFVLGKPDGQLRLAIVRPAPQDCAVPRLGLAGQSLDDLQPGLAALVAAVRAEGG